MKNLIKCIAFSLILAIAVSASFRVLNLKDTGGGDGDGDLYTSYGQLYDTKKDLIDVVFLGNSHCYDSVYPAVIWRDYGIAAFDVAFPRQTRNSSVHALKEVLKTQHPKVVCVELYILFINDTDDKGSLYRNYLTMRRSLNMAESLKGDTTDDWGDIILKWPVVHTRYRELAKYDFYRDEFAVNGRGEDIRMGIRNGAVNDITMNSKESSGIKDIDREWIDTLCEMSREEDFELVFFLAPYFVFDGDRVIVNGVKEYCSSIGVPVLDYTCDPLISDIGYDAGDDMMGDFQHNNIYGATKISKYFGNYLDENYGLIDHRGDIRYGQWDIDAKRYEHLLTEQLLVEKTDDAEYLELVSGLKESSVVLSLDGDFENAEGYMDLFGVDASDYLGGGKWIYKDGTAERVMANNAGESHFVPLGRFDGLKLQCVDDTLENVFFNRHSYVLTENGLNVLVYDDIREKLISYRGIE